MKQIKKRSKVHLIINKIEKFKFDLLDESNMTNSTYSHALMNNNKDNSFCECIARNDDDSCTSRGVNYTTHNILSARGSKNPIKSLNINKANLSFHSRASSRNNFVKCETDRENKKKAIRKSIHDLISRNFNMNNYYKNMNNNKKKESVFNNINKIKSFSNGLKMKSKEIQSRNQNQITLKQLNGKELSFGLVDESGNGNKKEGDEIIKD